MIAAGRMRHRVQVQSPGTSQDGYGAPVQTWTPGRTVWAAVEPLSGRELQQAQQTRADISHKVTIRYYPGLAPDGRFVLQDGSGRVFNIQSILDTTEVHRVQACQCKEVV